MLLCVRVLCAVSRSPAPPASRLSTGPPRTSRRSPYSSVDSERYSSLVRSVMSSRTPPRTPQTLSQEDEHVFGPVVRGQAAPDRTEPRTPHPLLNPRRTLEPEPPGPGPPVRVRLDRAADGPAVPSVTRVLQQTLSPEQTFYLDRWRRRMVAALGEDGFRRYTLNVFRQGKLFHAALEDILASGTSWRDRDASEGPPEVRGYVRSVAHILEDVNAVSAIESTVQHGALNYLGVVDCVARFRGVLCVIDWKTSERPKPFLSSTYDSPVQVAAYAGALNNDHNYPYQVENGLIVVAYKDGSPGHAHQLDADLMSDYWNAWLLRLERFTEQRSRQSSTSSSENR